MFCDRFCFVVFELIPLCHCSLSTASFAGLELSVLLLLWWIFEIKLDCSRHIGVNVFANGLESDASSSDIFDNMKFAIWIDERVRSLDNVDSVALLFLCDLVGGFVRVLVAALLVRFEVCSLNKRLDVLFRHLWTSQHACNAQCYEKHLEFDEFHVKQ